MITEIIEIDSPIDTLCLQTDDVPNGIKGIFHELETRVGNLQGKKFYGAVLCEGDKLLYKACVKKEPGMNIPGTAEYIIPPGKYARTVMKDWPGKIPMIKDTFMEMMKQHEPDHSRPQVEYYKSEKELILLQPVV